jgi:hypothetical protein
MWGTLGERLGTSTSVHSALLLALVAKSVAADAFGTCCGPGRATEMGLLGSQTGLGWLILGSGGIAEGGLAYPECEAVEVELFQELRDMHQSNLLGVTIIEDDTVVDEKLAILMRRLADLCQLAAVANECVGIDGARLSVDRFVHACLKSSYLLATLQILNKQNACRHRKKWGKSVWDRPTSIHATVVSLAN